jgi:hypothetical protein
MFSLHNFPQGEGLRPGSRVGDKCLANTIACAEEDNETSLGRIGFLITELIPPPSNHLAAYLSRKHRNCKIITAS